MFSKSMFTFLFAFGVVGCGEDIPSVADGKKVLETHVAKEGCLKVVSFEKTNASKREFGGMKMYEMEYLANYELVAPCFGEYSAQAQNFGLGVFPKKLLSPLEAQYGRSKKFESGTKFVVKGRLGFTKKENGWEGSKGGF